MIERAATGPQIERLKPRLFAHGSPPRKPLILSLNPPKAVIDGEIITLDDKLRNKAT